MTPDEVKTIYDDRYAAGYDQLYLRGPHNDANVQQETEFIRDLLEPGLPWLDAACGTGHFLSLFPEVERVGFDISPAMLRMARRANPTVDLREHDFRVPLPAFDDRFGLVSCMWFAYGLVDSMREVSRVIENLAAWTAPSGHCFMPLCDPAFIVRQAMPYRLDPPDPHGDIIVTGIMWSFVEDAGTKTHAHQIAPAVEFMVEAFQAFFADVRVVRYDVSQRPALIASRKR